MRKIRWSMNAGFAGCTSEDEFMVEDETTEQEINEMVLQAVLDRLDWGWLEVMEGESK